MTTQGVSARRRVTVSLLPGLLAVGGVRLLTRQWDLAAVAGWDVAALTFLSWTWGAIWRLDDIESRRNAEREDPTQTVADLVLLTAAVASLGGVGVVLATGKGGQGAGMLANLALAAASVAVSWAVVHTTYTLKYARLYYAGVDGGIDFHSRAAPAYKDFAYVAFTVGMTFQVSDTDIESRIIRATILRHALISYLFGAIILAATINLLAGLSK